MAVTLATSAADVTVAPRPPAAAAFLRGSAAPARPAAPRPDVLELRLRRVRDVMRDFEEAAAELDRLARSRELRDDPVAALVDRAHARQMRLCVARLAGALGPA